MARRLSTPTPIPSRKGSDVTQLDPGLPTITKSWENTYSHMMPSEVTQIRIEPCCAFLKAAMRRLLTPATGSGKSWRGELQKDESVINYTHYAVTKYFLYDVESTLQF